jgi:hypothetical protein
MIKLYRRSKPTPYYSKPEERVTSISIDLEGDAEVSIPKGAKSMKLSYVREADGGFGHRQEHSATIIFEVDEQPNPNLEEEAIAYERNQQYHLEDLAKWEEEMKKIDQEEEKLERDLLAELEAKYK